jgi:arsenate reductase (thioredoxin)
MREEYHSLTEKQRVLILCTGNSARSQMAEGLLRAKAGDKFEVFSAGSNPTGTVHPMAIQVMGETGINIEGHTSKNMMQYIHDPFDYVVTVCDNAAEACPVFPGKMTRLHHSFSDPAKAPAEMQLDEFRRVRDEIGTWLEEHFVLSEYVH